MTTLSYSEKRSENIKWLFVFVAAKRDLNIAKKYIEKILASKDGVEREALTITLHVVYGRIFGKNYGLPKLKIECLSCHLTQAELDLHYSIIYHRDTIFAHSDLSKNKIQVSLKEGKLEAYPSYSTTLIDNHHETASTLFDKLIKCSDEKINELLEILYGQNNNLRPTDSSYVLLGCSDKTIWEEIRK